MYVQHCATSSIFLHVTLIVFTSCLSAERKTLLWHFLPPIISVFYCSFPFFLPLSEGRLEVNMSEISLEEVERSLLEREPTMALGGFWKPKDCLPRWKVSVLVCVALSKVEQVDEDKLTGQWGWQMHDCSCLGHKRLLKASYKLLDLLQNCCSSFLEGPDRIFTVLSRPLCS